MTAIKTAAERLASKIAVRSAKAKIPRRLRKNMANGFRPNTSPRVTLATVGA
jgi:hypothetical protein